MKFRCRRKLSCALKTVLGLSVSLFVIFHVRDETPVRYAGVHQKNGNVISRPWYFKRGLVRPRNGGVESLKLWPNEAKHDRILDQLMFVPKNEPQSIKKIYLKKLQNLKFQEGSQIFNELNCPVNSCELVLNDTIADAVIFEDYVTRVRKPFYYNQVWILHSLESPFFSGQVIQQTSVNWTASYRLDSDLVTPYDKWVYYDEKQKVAPLRKNYAAGKTKKVAWLVSNCHSKNKRLEYAKTLAKYISVDIYGTCGNKVCLKYAKQNCRNFISENYKFYLSFENANCRDYITEKFYLNGLRSVTCQDNVKVHSNAGKNYLLNYYPHDKILTRERISIIRRLDVIPIVMGPPKEDYEKVAPHNSFIHVEDFPSPKHLAEYLHRLDQNDMEYNVYFSWKDAGEFINTYFLCRLCGMLHAGRGHHFYRKITHWWRNPDTCTKTFWNKTNRATILSDMKKKKLEF